MANKDRSGAKNRLKVCRHACGCVFPTVNRPDGRLVSTGPFFVEYGGQLLQHQAKSSHHPNCTNDCPASETLKEIGAKGRSTGRNPTERELRAWASRLLRDPKYAAIIEHIRPELSGYKYLPLPDGLPPHPLPDNYLIPNPPATVISSHHRTERPFFLTADATFSPKAYKKSSCAPVTKTPIIATSPTIPSTPLSAFQSERGLYVYFIETPSIRLYDTRTEAGRHGDFSLFEVTATAEDRRLLIPILSMAPKGYSFVPEMTSTGIYRGVGVWLIHDMVWWSICLAKAGFRIRWASWSQYWEVVSLNQRSPGYTWLKEAAFVVGGVCLQRDWVNETPNLTPEFMGTFIRNFLQLNEDVIHFPHPMSVYTGGGDKLAALNRLSAIAGAVTKTAFYKVYVLDDEATAEDFRLENWYILKRGCSSSNNHIIGPERGLEGGRELIKGFEDLRAPSWSALRALPDCPIKAPVWFAQPWNPCFNWFAELRCYVGGLRRLSYVVAIGKLNPLDDAYDRIPVHALTPLDVLSERHFKEEDGHMHLWVDPTDVSEEEGLKGWKELEDFVLKTLNALVIVEELETGFTASIRMMARVDVSLIANQATGRFQFVVNEIERNVTAALFRGDAAIGGPETFFEDVLSSLHILRCPLPSPL